METGEGFAMLAMVVFGVPGAAASAATHFKSAAILASVGAAVGVIGRAIPGESAGAGRSCPYAVTGEGASNSGVITGIGGGNQGPAVQVIFEGPVYGGQAGMDELVQHISEAVDRRDVALQSYTSARPATRRA
jgi:hypothetical protein